MINYAMVPAYGNGIFWQHFCMSYYYVEKKTKNITPYES